MASDYKKTILNALNEDTLPDGDFTSNCLIEKGHKSSFSLTVSEDAVLAGLDIFKETFFLLDESINIESTFSDGDQVKANTVIATISGSTLSILKGERTALNFLCHLSGIATVTRKIFDLIKNTGTTLLDTRKTTPGLRLFEKKAVLAGGGQNHRFNLSDMILIKDNHIASAGSIANAILKAKKVKGEAKIEIEVENIEQLKEVIPLKPDIIMFDNWKVEALKDALKLVPGDILTEASGQITLENILEYAKSGVKYISTSYMIKNARWIDFSLNAT